MEVKYSYELIKDYLDGILDSETSIKIKELLSNDAEARAIAKGILILSKEFDNDDSKIDTYLDSLLDKHRLQISRQSTVSNWSLIKIAAVLTLLIVSGIVLFKTSQVTVSEFVDKELSEPYKSVQVFRNSEVTNLSKGLLAYAHQDYQLASDLFTELDDSEAVFYHGLSQMYLGNYQAAIKLLGSETIHDSRYAEHGQWFEALSLIQLGEVNEAKQVLQKIALDNAFKKEEAKQLILLIGS